MQVENQMPVKAGAKWEQQFFGCAAENFPCPVYEPLHQSLNTVAKSQAERGWNPRNPPTEMGQRLFRQVQHYLRLKDASDLRLYCALGTALDRFHSADGFFRVRTHIVLFDLTVRRDKAQRKSVIFREYDRSLKKIERVARQVALLLNESINRII